MNSEQHNTVFFGEDFQEPLGLKTSCSGRRGDKKKHHITLFLRFFGLILLQIHHRIIFIF